MSSSNDSGLLLLLVGGLVLAGGSVAVYLLLKTKTDPDTTPIPTIPILPPVVPPTTAPITTPTTPPVVLPVVPPQSTTPGCYQDRIKDTTLWRYLDAQGNVDTGKSCGGSWIEKGGFWGWSDQSAPLAPPPAKIPGCYQDRIKDTTLWRYLDAQGNVDTTKSCGGTWAEKSGLWGWTDKGQTDSAQIKATNAAVTNATQAAAALLAKLGVKF